MFTGFGGFPNRAFKRPNINKDSDEAIDFYHYSINWVVFSWFIGFGLVVYFLYNTMITIDTIFHIFIGIGVVATLIHFYLTPHRQWRMLPTMAFYNFIGMAALVAGLFLTLNFTFQGQPQEKVVTIKEVSKERRYGARMNRNEVILDNRFMEEHKHLIDFRQWYWSDFKKAKAIKVTMAEGLFGFNIYKKASLVYK